MSKQGMLLEYRSAEIVRHRPIERLFKQDSLNNDRSPFTDPVFGSTASTQPVRNMQVWIFHQLVVQTHSTLGCFQLHLHVVTSRWQLRSSDSSSAAPLVRWGHACLNIDRDVMNYCQFTRSCVLSIIFPLNNPYQHKSFWGRGCQMEKPGSADSSGCFPHSADYLSVLAPFLHTSFSVISKFGCRGNCLQ